MIRKHAGEGQRKKNKLRRGRGGGLSATRASGNTARLRIEEKKKSSAGKKHNKKKLHREVSYKTTQKKKCKGKEGENIPSFKTHK